MYFDLFLPFPVVEPDQPKKKSKSKNKQPQQQAGPSQDGQASRLEKRSCWDGLSQIEREGVARDIGLAGHLGYSVVGCTIINESPGGVIPSPFAGGVPYPELDPRFASASTSSGSSSSAQRTAGGVSKGGKLGGPSMVQVSRLHMRLEDNKTHALTNANTAALRVYDILSVMPLSDKALQLACTDLSNPGPNQISIITLPLHERPYHFRLNRKQMKQAARNGVMFELLYSPGLFPSPRTPPDQTRRYRQNTLSNAREIIRITGGKGLILSSGATGPGQSDCAVRGPLDVINLGIMLGMSANLAKDAVSLNPKKVLLNAQARRTFKAIFSAPKMVPPPAAAQADAETKLETQPTATSEAIEQSPSNGVKRSTDTADAAGAATKKKARKA